MMSTTTTTAGRVPAVSNRHRDGMVLAEGGALLMLEPNSTPSPGCADPGAPDGRRDQRRTPTT